MITYAQETDARAIFQVPVRWPSVLTWRADDETEGGDSLSELGYFVSPFRSEALVAASALARRLGPTAVGNQARLLLSAIREAISVMRLLGLDTDHIPQMHGHVVEDGSVLFEWILPQSRVGFSLEQDPGQSGWFLVTSEQLGGISGSGFLDHFDFPMQLRLTGFVINNS